MCIERSRSNCTWKEGKRSTVSAYHEPVYMSGRESKNKELTRASLIFGRGIRAHEREEREVGCGQANREQRTEGARLP